VIVIIIHVILYDHCSMSGRHHPFQGAASTVM
jgi:hypothetical protein